MIHICGASLVAQMAKNLPAMQGTLSVHGSGRSPREGNGYPLQYSCLGNSMDRGTWWATGHGLTESDTTEWLTLNNNKCMCVGLPRWPRSEAPTCQCRRCKTRVQSLGSEDPWSRKWQPTLGFLPRKVHGQHCLIGYSPRSLKESYMIEHTQHIRVCVIAC